jgi:hypothetical protein
MAKKPDLYAAIKAQSATSRAQEPTAERETTGSETATAAPASETHRVASSRDLTAIAKETVATFARESGSTRPRGNVSTHDIERPKGFNVRPPRIEKPHQSVYAHPKVFAVLRLIAATEEKKPQDLYKEGLRAVLSKRGYDFDKLDAGEDA